MGSDDLFHKRKGKLKDSLARKKGTKEPAPLYLIVCEGEKTEPNYFNELRNFERISSITVKVSGECGSAPISVAEYALDLYENLLAEGNVIERVFCVFDRDNHSSFHKACALIERSAKSGVPIEAVTSIPCFEYWIVLHFGNFRAAYNDSGNATAAKKALKHLQTFIIGYSKGNAGIYAYLKPNQADAIRNAKLAMEDAQRTAVDDPSTQIHVLVEKLLEHSNA